MAENDAMEGKKLDFELKIREAIRKAEEQQIEKIDVNIGQMPFLIQIKREGKAVKIYAFAEKILTLEDEKFTYNIEGLKAVQDKLQDSEYDYSQFGLPDIEYLEELEQQREENQKSEEDLSEDMGEKEDKEPEVEEKTEKEKGKTEKQNPEQEQMKKDSKSWQEMDLGREFTDSDDLRKFIRDVLKQDCDRVYRVKTGTHDFKYMAEKDGKYQELNLSTDYEGRNTRQQVYIVQEDGKVELDEVDSLLLSKDEDYGIATKLPDTGSSDTTKSFAVTRTNDGKYVATQLIEKSGQNRDPKLPGKDYFDRAQGREEKADLVENIEEMENKDLEIAKDEVTVQEIGLYEHFEREGYRHDEIDQMIKYMEEEKKTVDEAEELGKKAREIKQKNPNQMEGQEWYLAKKSIDNVDNSEDGQRAKGGYTPDQGLRKRPH